MHKRYKLTVVTVTYKTNPDELKKCIDSYNLYNDLGEESKLIVVDNSPEEYRIVEEVVDKYENVDYIPNPANTGFGAANNIGAAAVESDYILFFNNDTELVEPVFQPIIKYFEENEKLGCVGIKQAGGGISYFLRSECSVLYPSAEIKEVKKNNQYTEKYHFLSGSFLFFTREAFEKAGKFDENIFMYCEEVDILNRLHQSGYTSAHLPNLQFIHRVENRKKIREYNFSKANINSRDNGINSFYYYVSKYDLPNKEQFLRSRTKKWRKRQLYFLLHLNLREVARFQQIIAFERTVFDRYFKNER